MGIARKNENGVYVTWDSISCSRYSFEGTAESLKAYIDSIVEEANAKGMISDGSFDISMNRGFYDDYELNISYEFNRVENDKERATREKAEAVEKDRKAKDRKKAAEKRKLKADAEYAEYERLKAKFEVGETE
jgi:hypothetical protein